VGQAIKIRLQCRKEGSIDRFKQVHVKVVLGRIELKGHDKDVGHFGKEGG
jgi:hypothetical protein